MMQVVQVMAATCRVGLQGTDSGHVGTGSAASATGSASGVMLRAPSSDPPTELRERGAPNSSTLLVVVVVVVVSHVLLWPSSHSRVTAHVTVEQSWGDGWPWSNPAVSCHLLVLALAEKVAHPPDCD